MIEGRRDPLAIMAMVVLALSLFLGGASAGDALRLALLELAALPVLLVAGHRLWTSGAWRQTPLALTLAALALAIPLAQLTPLPPELWSALPGRQDPALALGFAGGEAWLPASLTPETTWRYVLALLPPLAVFLATLALAPTQRRSLVAVVLVGAAISVMLGALQLASGGNPGLYLDQEPDRHAAVGFFVNRNHLASLLVMSLPLAGVFVGSTMRQTHLDRRLQVTLAVLFALLAIIAIATTRSRAGVLLAAPALAGAVVVAWSASTAAGRTWRLVMLGLAIATALGGVALYRLSPLMARFDQDLSAEQRFQAWPSMAAAADPYLPIGSGLGSFVPVYAAAEPVQTLSDRYWNNAHNDYLELWIETGWAGALGVGLFLLWWAQRSYHLWRSFGSPGDLGRAASISIGLVLLHSLGDYPLRTEAVATLFALACAVLASPTERDRSRSRASSPK